MPRDRSGIELVSTVFSPDRRKESEDRGDKGKQDVLCQLPFLAFLFGPVVTAGRRFKCIKLFKNLQDHEIILYLLALWQGEFANWLMRRTFIMETSDTLAGVKSSLDTHKNNIFKKHS